MIEGISYIFFVYYDRDRILHGYELATLCAVDSCVPEGSISPVDYFFHGLLCLAVSLKAHEDVAVIRLGAQGRHYCGNQSKKQYSGKHGQDDNSNSHCITPDIQSAQIRA